MTDFSKGKWIEWTGKDREGTFAHVGQIVESTKTTVTFSYAHGGLITTDKADGEFKNVRARKTSTIAVIGKAVRKREVAKKTAKRAPKAGSKKVRAISIYREMATVGIPTRQAVIDRFVADLGMTAAGASTYAAMAKKAYNS